MKHQNNSKKVVKFLCLVVMMVSLANLLAVNAVVYAVGDKPADTSGKPPPPIPDSFSVNTYLKLKDQNSRVPGKDVDPTKEPVGVTKFILDGVDLFIKLIGSIALVVFIVGALLTIASEGKEDLLEKGKTAMVYAVIGVVVSLMAFIIVTFVQSVLF